jgi:hypothetical protein
MLRRLRQRVDFTLASNTNAMSRPELVKIAACANAIDAEQIRSRLEQHGIAAFLDGANANTALSHVGTALGGVRVLVRMTDAEQAAEIVASARRDSMASPDPWYCGQCEEEIEGGFDICWSCGNARADVGRPLPVTSDDQRLEPARGADFGEVTPTPDYDGYDDANPYTPPITPDSASTQRAVAPELNKEAEAMLVRAWRASIIGTIFLPIVLHFYSMYLLIRAANMTPVFSPSGRKKFYRAFAVNVVAGCLWGLAIHTMFV